MHGKHITFTPPCVARMLTSGLFMLVTHEWVTCVILPGICENSESNGGQVNVLTWIVWPRRSSGTFG